MTKKDQPAKMVRHKTVKNLITGEGFYDTLHAKAESKVSRDKGLTSYDRRVFLRTQSLG